VNTGDGVALGTKVGVVDSSAVTEALAEEEEVSEAVAEMVTVDVSEMVTDSLAVDEIVADLESLLLSVILGVSLADAEFE
jgi:RNA 3'-terminal phosphate cyclase